MKKLAFLFVIFIFIFPFCRIVFASDPIDMSGERTTITVTNPQTESTGGSGIVPCGENGTPCTLCHLIIGIWNLIEWGKNILVTVAIVAIFISGIMYTVSTGNEKLITQAKAFLTASLVGFAITLAAWLIVDVAITWVANADPQLGIGKSSWHTFTCDTASSASGGSSSTGVGSTAPPTCAVPSGETQVISTPPEFTMNNRGLAPEVISINKAQAAEITDGENSYFISGLNPSSASLKDIKEKGSLSVSVCTNVKNPTKFAIGIGIAEGNVSKKFYATSQNFKIISEDAKAGTKTYTITFPYESEKYNTNTALLAGDYDFGIVISSSETAVVSKSLSISDDADGCQFIYGNKDAKFILILARINTHFIGLSSQPCSDSVEMWDENNTDQTDTFKTKVSFASSGANANDLSDNFGVYRSDKVFTTTQTNICPDVESKKEYVSYGWIQNGSGKTAYGDMGNNAYYCIGNISPNVLAHEQIGHNFAFLSDEYSPYKKFNDAKLEHNYNCTTNKECTKWKTIETGCHSGCLTQDSYRSSENSLMNNHLTASAFSALQEYIIKKTISSYPNQHVQLKSLDE